MVAASMKVYLFEFCFVLLIASIELGRLPPVKRNRYRHQYYVNQRGYAPLITSNKERMSAQYDNIMRKTHYGANVESDENVELDQNVDLVKPRVKMAAAPKYEFDDNGMIFLSQPKDRGDRNLNSLMNKIVQYKMDESKNEFLRHNPDIVFSEKELQMLQNIVGGIENDADDSLDGLRSGPVEAKVAYDFADLVVG